MNTRILNFIALILCCAGIYVAGYLSYHHLYGGEVSCRFSGEGCMAIQNHPSSKWFGIPVAVFGFVGYLLILAATVVRMIKGETRSLLRAGFALSIVGALASIALQVYGAIVIKATCDWCMASAIILCILAVVYAFLVQAAPDEDVNQVAGKKKDLVVIGLFIAGAAIGLGAVAFNSQSTGGQKIEPGKITSADALIEGAPSMGPADAPITIVEFADLFCASCQTSFAHMQKLQKEHPGKIRWVFRHFPLFTQKGHELALPSAVVAEIANRQGKFWEFVGQLYSMDYKTLTTMDSIYAVAANVNVDVSNAPEIIESDKAPEIKRVTDDINLAQTLGINETPTFIMFIDGKEPVALRRKDLDAKMNSSEIRALLQK